MRLENNHPGCQACQEPECFRLVDKFGINSWIFYVVLSILQQHATERRCGLSGQHLDFGVVVFVSIQLSPRLPQRSRQCL